MTPPVAALLRIGDAEREQSVAALGRHLGAGRLTMAEFESRLDVVYAARTRGELDEVLADLPASEPTRRPAAPSESRSTAWTPWALTGTICLLIWIATSLAQGQALDFWPVWVIGPWGVVLLAGARFSPRRRRADGCR